MANASSKRLKVGVVGAGFAHGADGRENFAIRAHLPALKAQPERFEIVAVCTTRQESADEAAKHFGAQRGFAGIERMLEGMPEIDVVCVSVRPPSHYAVVMPALKAGKHVYCEHPVGNSVAQAQEMYAMARAKGVQTAIGHQQHYHPAAMEMTRLIREGFIGRPLMFNLCNFASNYIVPRPSHRQWIFQAEAGGHPGYRSGLGLERILGVLGRDITAICADMKIKVPERRALDGGGMIKSDQVDTMGFLLELEDGLSGSLQVSNACWFGGGERFEVYGSDGMLMLQSSSPNEGWKKETGEGDPNRGGLRLYGSRIDMDKFLADPIPPERLRQQYEEIPTRSESKTSIPEGRASYYVAQAWAAFHEAIVTGTPYTPGFKEALKIHDILDASERSVARRGWADVNYGNVAG